MEDTRLIQRLRRHSRTALEEAIRRYTSYVSVTVWRTLSAGGSAPREDVEEVVSDVFLSLWKHAGELHADKDLRPWLGAVARNKAIDRLRRAPAPVLPLSESDAAPQPAPRRRPSSGSGRSGCGRPWTPWTSPTTPSSSVTTGTGINSRMWHGT